MKYDNEGKWKLMAEDEHSYDIVRYIVSAVFTRHARQTGVKIAPFLVVNVFQ